MKKYRKFYYVRGKVYEESNTRKSLVFANHYAEEQGFDKSEIYELRNDNELKFLKALLSRDDVYEIKSHEQVCLVGEFNNSNGDVIPKYMLDVSFTYVDKVTNKGHVVVVVDSVYKLNRELKLSKTLYDLDRKDSGCYLEVYFYENDKLVEWKIGDNDHFINERKEQHKKFLAQRRVLRDREKFDRLLKMREKGTITDAQRKELYRLEKVFGGK